MTMNMRKTFSAAAIVAVLACSAAHAQVLGGSVGGAVNGALGGGMRDTSVFGNGNASGALGGQLDTGSLIDRTRGAADQTTHRARNVGANVRNRAESSVTTARDTGANTRDTSANIVSSTASQLDTTTVSSATQAAASHGTALGSTASESTASEPQQDEKSLELAPSLSGGGATQLDRVTGDANGSASGRASASRSRKKRRSKALRPGPPSGNRGRTFLLFVESGRGPFARAPSKGATFASFLICASGFRTSAPSRYRPCARGP
jgi:hypothetical protein